MRLCCYSKQEICVLFIPYFRLLVFGILVTLVFFLGFFLSLVHLALQNVNNDYIIFFYFLNFVAKSDQKAKMKNGMNKTMVSSVSECSYIT